jgi:hypothetical protein
VAKYHRRDSNPQPQGFHLLASRLSDSGLLSYFTTIELINSFLKNKTFSDLINADKILETDEDNLKDYKISNSLFNQEYKKHKLGLISQPDLPLTQKVTYNVFNDLTACARELENLNAKKKLEEQALSFVIDCVEAVGMN